MDKDAAIARANFEAEIAKAINAASKDGKRQAIAKSYCSGNSRKIQRNNQEF